MSRLVNTNVHFATNDISVTSGNADGWVVLDQEPLVIPARPSAAMRSPEVAEKKTKRPRKARV
jgi:hypothetical protein